MSLRLSPLDRLEPFAAKLMTSAESRLAAASNEIRVRVESSKNRFTTVRPRSAGSFLIGRSASDRISSAVVRTCSASSRLRSAALSRWRFMSGLPPGSVDRDGVHAVGLLEPDADPLHQRRGQVLADEVGADRQLPVAAVDEDRETHPARPADVVQRVERGADGAPGEQHVVDQDHGLVVDAARRDLGRQQRAGRLHPQVVAVHRGVERPDRDVEALHRGDPLGDPLGQRHTAAGDAEEHEVARALVAFEDLVGDPGQCPVDVTGVENNSTVRRGIRRCRLGAHEALDLLLRLTGRLVKGCLSALTLLTPGDGS